MDGLVICDGRRTTPETDVETPLLDVGGEPMIDSVLAALADSAVDDVYVAVSPRTRATAEHVERPLVETHGDGYVADLETALLDHRIDEPVLAVSAHLPLLEADAVDDVLDAHESGSLTVAVPTFLKSAIGVSVGETFTHDGEELAPAGVAVVDDGPDRTLVRDDARLAVDVSSVEDATVAERLAASR